MQPEIVIIFHLTNGSAFFQATTNDEARSLLTRWTEAATQEKVVVLHSSRGDWHLSTKHIMYAQLMSPEQFAQMNQAAQQQQQAMMHPPQRPTPPGFFLSGN